MFGWFNKCKFHHKRFNRIIWFDKWEKITTHLEYVYNTIVLYNSTNDWSKEYKGFTVDRERKADSSAPEPLREMVIVIWENGHSGTLGEGIDARPDIFWFYVAHSEDEIRECFFGKRCSERRHTGPSQRKRLLLI